MHALSNRLLDCLSIDVIEALRPNLATIDLIHGAILADSDTPVRNVYFPQSGIISLVVELSTGDMVETAMVGRDGVFNAASALDGKVSLNKALSKSPAGV